MSKITNDGLTWSVPSL